MRIYLDLDDILCETARSLCNLATKLFNRHVAYEDVFDFNLQTVFHLTDAEMQLFMATAHETANLLSYPITPDAVTGVHALQQAGWQVDILTGRPASAHIATRTWLDRAGLQNVKVEYVDKYNRNYTPTPNTPPTLTLEDIRQRTYDIIVDDSPVVIKQITTWEHTQILLFDRPWNRTYPETANVKRIANWQHLVREVLIKL